MGLKQYCEIVAETNKLYNKLIELGKNKLVDEKWLMCSTVDNGVQIYEGLEEMAKACGESNLIIDGNEIYFMFNGVKFFKYIGE